MNSRFALVAALTAVILARATPAQVNPPAWWNTQDGFTLSLCYRFTAQGLPFAPDLVNAWPTWTGAQWLPVGQTTWLANLTDHAGVIGVVAGAQPQQGVIDLNVGNGRDATRVKLVWLQYDRHVGNGRINYREVTQMGSNIRNVVENAVNIGMGWERVTRTFEIVPQPDFETFIWDFGTVVNGTSVGIDNVYVCTRCVVPPPVVAPVNAALVEGNSNNAFPWNSATARRYTQIHSDIGGVPRSITQLAFRQNAGNTTNYTGTYACDLEMFMADAVDWSRASFVFAQNYAGARVPVFARRVLNLGPQGPNATVGPMPFTVVVPLDGPYAYAGTQSLMWEALVHGNTLSGNFNQVDAESGSATSGASMITGTGCLATGRTLAMTHNLAATDRCGMLVLTPTLSDGPSGAASFLALGLSNPNLPISGLCARSYTDLLTLIGVGSTNAAGAITGDSGLAFTFPTNTLAGATLTSQMLSLDVGRPDPIPLALSNGRAVVIPASNLSNVVAVSRIYNNTGGPSGTIAAAVTSSHGYGIMTEFR